MGDYEVYWLTSKEILHLNINSSKEMGVTLLESSSGLKKTMPLPIDYNWVLRFWNNSQHHVNEHLKKRPFSLEQDKYITKKFCHRLFSMSNLIITLLTILGLIWWMISWASMMFSDILLPFKNIDLLGEIKEGRTGPWLLLTSLEMIFLVKLLKIIGLNSINWLGLFTLGRNTMLE